MDEILNDILNQIKAGDKRAFQELYKLYYKRVYYFALQISKNSQDAQDIAQETFIQLHKSLPKLKENRAFSVWLHRIIVSKAGLLFRKNKDIAMPDDYVGFQHNQEERSYLLPTESMHFNSDKEMLAYFINQLDEKYRLVLTLSYFNNLRIKDIASILEIPEGTVKSRMNTAKDLLKQKIENYQTREGVLLDFRTIDMAGVLTAFFIAETSKITVPLFTLQIFPKFMKSIGNSIGMQIAGTCAIVATGVILSYGVYHAFQTQQENEMLKNALVDQAEASRFPQVKYNERVYTNAEDAYYELTLWAHCTIEMEKYTRVEREAIKPLYDALKNDNGVYWNELIRKKWNIDYEKFFY